MGTKATENAGLSADAHAVIGVVLEALDIPYAATVAHDETRTRILSDRILHLVVILRGMFRRGRADDVAGDLEYLREKLAEHPATGYVTNEQARERCDAGATWPEAVSLDYVAAEQDAQADDVPDDTMSLGAVERDLRRTIVRSHEALATRDPGDVSAALTDARATLKRADTVQAARLPVRLVEQADKLAPVINEFADQRGDLDTARALIEVALKLRVAAEALANGADISGPLDQLDDANARARAALAAVRAADAQDSRP